MESTASAAMPSVVNARSCQCCEANHSATAMLAINNVVASPESNCRCSVRRRVGMAGSDSQAGAA